MTSNLTARSPGRLAADDDFESWIIRSIQLGFFMLLKHVYS